MMHDRLDHRFQDSSQTLRDGLAEHRTRVANLLKEQDISPGMRQTLLGHDVAHVVFGCDTSARGEIVLARWSLFGTTDSMLPYLRALLHRETLRLFKPALNPLNLWRAVKALPAALLAVWRSFFMTRRWPSRDYDAYLDVPLREIRREFNIRVIG